MQPNDYLHVLYSAKGNSAPYFGLRQTFRPPKERSLKRINQALRQIFSIC